MVELVISSAFTQDINRWRKLFCISGLTISRKLCIEETVRRETSNDDAGSELELSDLQNAEREFVCCTFNVFENGAR